MSATAAVMREEILEQPSLAAKLLVREAPGLLKLREQMRKRRPKGIVLAARGSSDHAATYGRYLLEYLTGIPSHLAAPSLVTSYGKLARFKDYLVIGISQSGQGPDVNAVLKGARSQGALTLGITNNLRSGLARAAAHVLDLGAGEEKSVAATKTFTTELMALALLGALASEDSGLVKELAHLPSLMAEVLNLSEAAAERCAKGLKSLESCVVIGRGFQLGVAHEIGLKMKECAGVPALSYSTADFAHGPIALATKGFPVFLVSAPGKLEAEALEACQDLTARGAKLYRLGISEKRHGSRAPAHSWNESLLIPSKVRELFSPLLSILPGQWLAYHLALAKGRNPAAPQGLKKVTKTK